MYTPSATEVESTLSETNKHTFSLEASSEINFGDDSSTLSLGANYLQMKAVQDYTQTAQPEDQFRYREKIFSAYAEFSTSFADDKLDFAAGLRYEGAAIKWNYTNAEAGRMDSKDRFNDWFPSASLTYNMPSGKSYLTLEYERAISRPIMSDYDPAVFRESESVYIVGASHLLPEFEHVLSLTQTLNRMHTFSVSYTWNNDLYAEVYREQGDALVITSGNYGSSRTLQLFAQSRFWIVKNWLQGNVSGTANYVAFDHSTYGKTRSWEGRANAGLDLLLPKGWALGVSGYYATPTKIPIDRLSASWSLSAHVGKQIGPRCMLYLSGSNLLYNENLTITSRQPDVFFRNDIKNYFRKITLMLSCRFGSSKLSYVKRAQLSSDTKSRSSDNN